MTVCLLALISICLIKSSFSVLRSSSGPQDQACISRSSVARVRDTLALLIKDLSRVDAATFAKSAPVLVVRHLHDEACMRLRSVPPTPLVQGLAPGKYIHRTRVLLP